MAALLPDGVRVVRQGKLRGESFGQSSFTLYEACSPDLQEERPCVVVWLHGQDMGHIPLTDIRTMQRRLGRRVVCLVPRNPELEGNHRRFLWALGYTKAQNRNGLGFVYGELDAAYLESLNSVIRELAEEVSASHVVLCGYSMGGFGAYQLAGHCPQLYDAVVAVASHGLGTLEPQDQGYNAPQPESSQIFQAFLDTCAPGLAAVPLVLAVHARRDAVSRFLDAEGVIEAVRNLGGHAELVVVPDDMADSDLGRKNKSRLGHSYYYYSLVNDSSEEVLYSQLRTVLSLEGTHEMSADPATLPESAHESMQRRPEESKLHSACPREDDVLPYYRKLGAQAVAIAKCSREEVMSRTGERLQSNKNGKDKVEILRLVEECGLGDGVELALRMLSHEHLVEVLSGKDEIRLKLGQVEDADASMLWLISQLDPEVVALVGRLQEANGAQPPDIQEDSVEVQLSRDDCTQDQSCGILQMDHERSRSRSRSPKKGSVPDNLQGAPAATDRAAALRALRAACGLEGGP